MSKIKPRKYGQNQKFYDIFSRKKIIIILHSISLIFIITSFYYFAAIIPSLDVDISEKEEKFDASWDSHFLFQIMETQGLNTYNQIKILTEINSNSNKIEELERDLLFSKRNSLIYLYQFSTGNLADEERTLKWSKMNFNELENEKLELVDLSYLQNLFKSINEIKDYKQKILYRAVIFQVFGLIMNQIALILQIKWSKNTD